MGDDHVRAQRDADEQVDDQADDRTVRADCRHGRRLFSAGKVAHHRHVRGIEKLLQNRRRRYGQREARQLVPDRNRCSISSFCACKAKDFLLIQIPEKYSTGEDE